MPQAELYKYNPDQQPEEELEATFVAREGTLDSILDDLRAGAGARANQHFLIIGSRGIGKTTLLLMVRRRVNQDGELARAYLPVRTAEEEYSINSLRDFFARILTLLIEDGTDSDVQSALQAVNETADDQHAAELAIEALRKFSQSRKRKLLLLVDNIDLILGDQLSDTAELGRLRDLLMNESFLVLLGAASAYFGEVTRHDRPFFQFFRVFTLEELTVDEMAELLRKRAELDENRTLIDNLAELRPRLDAVYHMTGGNPRLALMLYQLATQTDLPEVRTALHRLLDEVTPYYKGRLEKLAPQQRKVIDTFARLGQPATPTELAKEVRLPVNQVNSILKRLRDLGFVAIAPQERRKSTLYMVADRVFRIWHQMRFSPASQRRIEFFIDFIRIWYTAEQWQSEADRLLDEYRRHAKEQRFLEAARFVEHLDYFAHAAPKPEWGIEVSDRTVWACIESGDFEHAEQILQGRISKERQAGNHDREAMSCYFMGSLRMRQNRWKEAAGLFERAANRRKDFYEAHRELGITALMAGAMEQSAAEQDRLLGTARAAFEKALEMKPEDASVRCGLGTVLVSMALEGESPEKERLLREALQHYERALELGLERANAAATLFSCGGILTLLAGNATSDERVRLLEEALAKSEAASNLAPDSCGGLLVFGGGLHAYAMTKTGTEQDRLLGSAREKLERALELEPSQNQPWPFGVCARNLRCVILAQAANALESQNVGHAFRLFSDALVHYAGADPTDAAKELLWFFRRVSREETAGSCAELLDAFYKRGVTPERGPLMPFRVAVEYWQTPEKKRAEVLDRLNPEVREVVEAIIRGERPGRTKTSSEDSTALNDTAG